MADVEAAPAAPQAHEFRAEIRQLLNILAHSLYTEREIFLRELISNAADALNRLRFEQLTNQNVRDPGAELGIWITADKDARRLQIRDTGIGMTHDELIENLGTIAHSGALGFLQKLQQDPQPELDVVGRFGVGFYSVFMVADEVKVTSRSYRPDAEAVEWVSRGENTYTIGPAEQAERGTTIELQLREDAIEFADTWRLEQIIRRHSDFIPFPIYVQGKTTPVNRQIAPWRRPAKEVTEEEYNAFYQQLTLDIQPPLAHIHLVSDAPVQVRALLYLPAHQEQGMVRLRPEEGLQLYSHNVLIQETCTTLLPRHFRFVAGVVDSEDLPLNISRETVQLQGNRVMERLRTVITKRVQTELERLAENDAERYRTFWTAWGGYLKEGVASDPGAREPLARLLRYPSSHTSGEELTSLQAYSERMRPDQEAIFYVLADNRQAAATSPHLDPFKARDLEVLYFVEPIDSFVAVSLREFGGKPLRNVDDPDVTLPALETTEQTEETTPVPEDTFGALLARMRETLGDQVLEVRPGPTLTTSPCRLVSPGGAPDRDLQRVRRYLEQEYVQPKKILEINPRSTLIRRLAARLAAAPTDPAIDLVITQLFDSALLQEGLHPNPADMVGRIQQLMEAAVGPAPGALAGEEPSGAAEPAADGAETAS